MSNPRQRLIAQIHIGKTQLGLDDDTYRELLKGAAGKDSCSKMNFAELHQVIHALKQRGFKTQPGKKKQGDKKPADLLDKLNAVWRDMGQQGIVRNASDAALRAYVSRLTNGKFEAPQFCDNKTLIRLIESLKQWQLRVKRQSKCN